MTSSPSTPGEPEPIEAEFEPAPRTAGAARRVGLSAPVTRGEVLAWSLGAVTLGALAAVLLMNTGLGGRAGDLSARLDQSEQTIAALRTDVTTQGQRLTEASSEVTSVRQQVNALGQQLAAIAGVTPGLGADGGNPIGRLIDRVATLETQLAEDADAPRTTRQMQRALRDLADQVAALDEASTDFTTALNRRQSALAQLESSVAQLETDFAELESRVAETEEVGGQIGEVRKSMTDLSTASERARAPVLAAAEEAKLVRALGDLSTAAEKGRPFASQQQTLARLLPNDPEIAALRDIARRGAPSLTELRRDFADARRAAERIAASASDDGWNWLRGSLSGLVTVRRTNADDRTSVQLRLAEQALDAGDARGAVAAVGELTGEAASALSAWRDRAERRADLDERVAALNVRLLTPSETDGDKG